MQVVITTKETRFDRVTQNVAPPTHITVHNQKILIYQTENAPDSQSSAANNVAYAVCWPASFPTRVRKWFYPSLGAGLGRTYASVIMKEM